MIISRSGSIRFPGLVVLKRTTDTERAEKSISGNNQYSDGLAPCFVTCLRIVAAKHFAATNARKKLRVLRASVVNISRSAYATDTAESELMENLKREAFFTSPVPFESARIQAAAVYCSDGRFGRQFDDLLQHGLQLPRYDRLAVPGGAACLASHFTAYREEEGVAEQLRFLISAHQLRRVVLIAHEGCAFYTQRLRVSPLQLESQQREDLQKAVRRVRSLSSDLDVVAFFARKTWEGLVQFELVE